MLNTSWLRKRYASSLVLERPLPKSSQHPFIRYLATRSDPFKASEPSRRKYYWLLGSGLVINLAGWEVYFKYTKREAKETLNPHEFKPYSLVSKERVSSSSSLFTVVPKVSSENAKFYEQAWLKGVWSVQFKQPQLQIARSYTPLPPSQIAENPKSSELRFLIRRDPSGEVSSYLHKLPLDAEIELRGPHFEYEIPEQVKEVLFLAGGTGIAPALQMVHSLLECRGLSEAERPRVRVIWANRRVEDAVDRPSGVLRQEKSWTSWFRASEKQIISPADADEVNTSGFAAEIRALKDRHNERLQIEYFVDEEKTLLNADSVKKYLATTKEEVISSDRGTDPPERLLIVSGPEGFVKYLAGSKTWKAGKEQQGPLGGVLNEIDTRRWNVWKL